MGSFFDSYTDLGGGGTFIKADEKQVLIEKGIPFEIVNLHMDSENQYGPRYVAFCKIPNSETGTPEERKISFPHGSGADSRDNMLKAMEEYLRTDGAEPVKVQLDKPGRAIMIKAAE